MYSIHLAARPSYTLVDHAVVEGDGRGSAKSQRERESKAASWHYRGEHRRSGLNRIVAVQTISRGHAAGNSCHHKLIAPLGARGATALPVSKLEKDWLRARGTSRGVVEIGVHDGCALLLRIDHFDLGWLPDMRGFTVG